MAKLLCFAALLLVASAMVAEAHEPAAPAPAPAKSSAAPVPAPAPSHSLIEKHPTFFLKCIIHNLADRIVTFKLVIQGKPAAKPVVAESKKWTAIGPVTLGCKVPVVVLHVTVKNNKGVAVTKSFAVKLAAFLKHISAKSSKYLVVTASEVESYRGVKKLVIKVGHKVHLVVRL